MALNVMSKIMRGILASCLIAFSACSHQFEPDQSTAVPYKADNAKTAILGTWHLISYVLDDFEDGRSPSYTFHLDGSFSYTIPRKMANDTWAYTTYSGSYHTDDGTITRTWNDMKFKGEFKGELLFGDNFIVMETLKRSVFTWTRQPTFIELDLDL